MDTYKEESRPSDERQYSKQDFEQQEDNITGGGIDASEIGAVSLSACQQPMPENRKTSKSRWHPDQLREAIQKMAEARLSGGYDATGLDYDIEQLAQKSGHRKTSIRRDLDACCDKLSASTENEKTTRELTAREKELAELIAKQDDIFLLHHMTLSTRGFPVESRISNTCLMAKTGRLLPKSSATIFYGPSASGKSAIFEESLKLDDPTLYETITSMSQKAWYYMDDVRNKTLAFGEVAPVRDGEDDEVQKAMRQFISENRLTRKTVETSDGPNRGEVLVVEGPCSIVASTTKDPQMFNDELVNRCYWVPSDDSQRTTDRVLQAQAEKEETPATVSDDEDEIVSAWRAFSLLLKPVPVIIPFAKQVIPKSRSLTVRRLYPLLLQYVKVSALLHQFSRERRTISGVECIVASKADYAIAVNLLQSNAPKTLEVCSKAKRDKYNSLKDYLLSLRKFTQADVIGKCDISTSTASDYIKAWLEAGLIEQEDEKRGNQNLYSCRAVDPVVQDWGLIPVSDVDFSAKPESFPTFRDIPKSIPELITYAQKQIRELSGFPGKVKA